MNDIQEKTGDTIPLYEEVKRNLYKLSQEMKNISSMILSTKNILDYTTYLKLFNENYIKFYIEVSTNKKISKISKAEQDYLSLAYKDIVKGVRLNRTQISKVNIITTNLIEELGISKIGANQKDTWAI